MVGIYQVPTDCSSHFAINYQRDTLPWCRKIRYVDETHTIDEHGQYLVSILKLALDKTKP